MLLDLMLGQVAIVVEVKLRFAFEADVVPRGVTAVLVEGRSGAEVLRAVGAKTMGTRVPSVLVEGMI